jgi:hypothetical protein
MIRHANGTEPQGFSPRGFHESCSARRDENMKIMMKAPSILVPNMVITAALLSGCESDLLCLPCVLANDPRTEASAVAAQWNAGEDEPDSCRENAMEHCMAASLLANSCGASCAIWAGEVNERLQRDGDPMDLHNNEQGAACSRGTTADANVCCEQLLDAGELRTDGRCR